MKIMVLSDGETFSNLQGCHIVEVPDRFTTEKIEEALRSVYAEAVEVPGVHDLGGFTVEGKFIKYKRKAKDVQEVIGLKI